MRANIETTFFIAQHKYADNLLITACNTYVVLLDV